MLKHSQEEQTKQYLYITKGNFTLILAKIKKNMQGTLIDFNAWFTPKMQCDVNVLDVCSYITTWLGLEKDHSSNMYVYCATLVR